MTQEQKRMSVDEAATLLECKKSYIYKLIERKKLDRVTAVKVYVSAESVKRFYTSRTGKPVENVQNVKQSDKKRAVKA